MPATKTATTSKATTSKAAAAKIPGRRQDKRPAPISSKSVRTVLPELDRRAARRAAGGAVGVAAPKISSAIGIGSRGNPWPIHRGLRLTHAHELRGLVKGDWIVFLGQGAGKAAETEAEEGSVWRVDHIITDCRPGHVDDLILSITLPAQDDQSIAILDEITIPALRTVPAPKPIAPADARTTEAPATDAPRTDARPRPTPGLKFVREAYCLACEHRITAEHFHLPPSPPAAGIRDILDASYLADCVGCDTVYRITDGPEGSRDVRVETDAERLRWVREQRDARARVIQTAPAVFPHPVSTEVRGDWHDDTESDPDRFE